MKTGIFYPYYQGGSKWEELRYSLRSLAANFQGDYEVWIVGDLPNWIKGVKHIPHERVPEGEERVSLDAISKLILYLGNKKTPERFIRMYDDIYLLQPISTEDLEITRYLYEDRSKLKLTSGGRVWVELLNRTLIALEESGYTTMMAETHCPQLFEKSKMLDVLDWFDVANKRLLTSTLYFNVFPYPNYLKDEKVQRALFYGTENRMTYTSDNIEEKVSGKYFLNHNDAGLNSALKRFLEEKFPNKSKFEK